jgi:uncharacterized membrane protein (UPF0182 family)
MAATRSKGGARGIIIAAVVVLLLLALSLTRFYTDVLWFREVGFQSVLWKSLATQLAVGVIVGVLVAVVVWINLLLASRIAPAYQIPRLEVIGRPDPLERYREGLGPYLRWVRLGVTVVVGLLAGAAASSSWQTFLLWANRVSFDVQDPQFGRDVGFYVFELPFLNQLLSWAWLALLIGLIGAVATHYLLGSIRPEGGLRGVASGALAHISVLLGLLALVKAAQYWLGTYSLNFSERGVVTGASYTDVNAHLPALRLLAIISVVSAVLFLVNIRFRRLSLPLAAVAIWIGFAFLAGGVWPWWVQRFVVDPQEQVREQEFIERNIEATRAAFDVADVREQSFAASSNLTSDHLRSNDDVLQNVRLWDPAILQQAYSQLQTIRLYYTFKDVDIDRYEIAGTTRQVLVAPRELALADLQENSRTWSNLHLQYTHGYGLVASLANASTPAGQPEFLVKDVPGTATPGAEDLVPQGTGAAVYFGEAFEPFEYSVVNTRQPELDYPTEEGVRRSSYQGEGGIEVGNILRRLAFAIRERDPNLVLSSLIRPDSRILIYRNVRERVRRVAPFLALDHDPYVAVIDGRLQWILDAYTSTRFYPYSQRFDATASVGAVQTGALSGDVNYVRNSVKVVIDAYNGTMTFHVIDEQDPLIQAWSKAFPDLFTTDEEPSQALREHFRYPEDLFQLQSDVFLTYHMTDPDRFYAREDQWAVATSPRVEAPLSAASVSEAPIPPTYLLVQLPGEPEQEFLLTRPFTPNRRSNMIAFMAAKSDPESYGELLTLEFPPDKLILGPSQVDQLINQDEDISRTLTLLGQQGSTIEYGSLVTLPIEESIIYIQPLFIRAESGQTVTGTGAGIPELKRIVLVFGEDVVLGDTFDDALAQLFGIERQPPAGEEPGPAPGDGGGGRLATLVREAGALYDRARAALANGDFETYGRLIARLGQVLEEAQALR